MPSERHQKTSDLFGAACELSPEARAKFLDEACSGDAKLRAEVEALLAQHEQHPSFLQDPAWNQNQERSGQQPEAVRSNRGLSDLAKRLHQEAGTLTGHPERVGPYRILEEVGEGGMGVVYLAEQTEPISRRVALKLIKLGMDTKQVIARFETERQALALMSHPNVARVLDAGSTEKGRPYFVMEYVAGESITAYCDRHRLTTKQRLGLFIQVCQAVQHAHQKGVIHRDIKPSNVLVGVEGDKAVPKVIDFGVAKAVEQKLTERTLFTEHGQLIGTPEYMSPEQAESTVLDIDTRTDIYSLGVLLYELLVGALPFDPTSLRQAAFGEIQHIIREAEPAKPSTRLSSLGDQSTSAAQKRHTDSTSLERQLRGDLDWITMKAIEKDRTRRCATAAEFADDIARHLNHEPVLASPPSAAYRMKKFLRRNKVSVTAATAIGVVLLGATGISVDFAFGEAEARNAERTAKEEAQDNLSLAQRQVEMTQSINDFLNNDLLAAVAPEQQGKDVLMRDVLDTASQAIEGKFDDAPLIEASIRSTLGNTYHNLGDLKKAEAHLVRAMEIRRAERGEEHPSTLQSMNDLAYLYKHRGRFDKAEPLYARSLELLRRVLGEEHQNTLLAMNNLATLYQNQGRFDQAELLYVKTLELQRRVLGEAHGDTLGSMNNLASLLSDQGRFDEAEPLHVKTLALQRRALGDEHPDTLRSMNHLAIQYSAQGRFVEAELLFAKTLELRRRVLGEGHPDTLGSINNLAALYSTQGRFEEAEPLCVEALELTRLVLGEEHPDTQLLRSNLLDLFKATDKLDQARALTADVLAGYQTLANGPNASADDLNGYAWHLLACIVPELRDPVTALEFATKAAEVSNEKNPFILDTLALAQQTNGDIAAAIETQTKAVALMAPGPSAQRSDLESNLVKYLLAGQRFAKAEPLLLAMHEQIVGSGDESPSKTQISIERLAKFYESWHAAEPGQGYDTKAAEWRAKLPPDGEAAEPAP